MQKPVELAGSGGTAGLFNRGSRRFHSQSPDLGGVVLHPTGLWGVPAKFFLSGRKRTTVRIVHYGARTRRALVKSNVPHERE